MSQSHKHSHHFHLVLYGAKASLFLSFVVLLIGLVLGYLSPASRSTLFGWSSQSRSQIAQGPSDLRLVGASADVSVDLIAKDGLFKQSSIDVKVGQILALNLKSEDREYSFFLPQNDIHIVFSKNSPQSLQLMFDKGGMYAFASSIYASGYEKTSGVIKVTQLN